MSRYSRELEYFDKGLMSGSGDPLRTALGIGRETFTDEHGQVSYRLPSALAGASIRTGVDRLIKNDYVEMMTEHDDSVSDMVRLIKYSAKSPIPIMKYPIRLYGDNSTIYNDQHWRTYFVGGMYGDQEYEPVFSDQEYTDHHFKYDLQDEPAIINKLRADKIDSFSKMEITYDYNHYYRKYEKKNAELESELLIPNGYLLQSISRVDEVKNYMAEHVVTYSMDLATVTAFVASSNESFANSLYGLDIVNFVSRENRYTYDKYNDFFFTRTDYESAVTAGDFTDYQIATPKTKQYFEYYYPIHDTTPRTADYVKQKFKNILIDNEAIANEYDYLYNNRMALPYYTRISIPPFGHGTIAQTFEDTKTAGKFLLTLKQIFVDNSLDTTPENITFDVNETGHLNPNYETSEVYEQTVRAVPMIDTLLEMRNNYKILDDDYYCIGNPSEISKRALYDKVGDYRHINTMSATKAIINLINDIDSYAFLEKIVNPFGPAAQQSKERETVAFRIEKIGGPATGDGNTQNVIQNFYIINSAELVNDFIDTQVKYGELYTYNIYAYVAVSGYRYQASDLRVTRVISDLSRPEDTEKVYCLEFYDPLTGVTKDRLVDEHVTLERDIDNRFATDAQIASAKYKFLADFNISVQPSVQLIEIPVATNTIRVMDHPVDAADVVPFQVKDNSHRIGLAIRNKTFEELPYPKTLSIAEDELKANYLDSNSLFETTNIKKPSVSSARYLEIYRTDERPTSYKDFQGKKIHTADLLIENNFVEVDEDGIPIANSDVFWRLKDAAVYNEEIFYDKIKPNTVYYYAMRFLNERMEPGHFSYIYTVNLINDGGYVYPKFDVIYDYQLNPDKAINTKKSFKKLINVIPHMQHVYFNDSNVDYSKSAYTQVDNLQIGLASSNEEEQNSDSLWGKKFKLRFTSKKTGKKIDLNISYELTRG